MTRISDHNCPDFPILKQKFIRKIRYSLATVVVDGVVVVFVGTIQKQKIYGHEISRNG
jgi:hypothetical protein